MKKKFSYLMASATLLLGNAVSTLAQPPQGFKQYEDASNKLRDVTSSLGNTVGPIFNIASAILGLVFIIYLVWNISQQQKGNDHAQDSLMKVGGGLLGAILLMQVIRILFFS